MPASRVAGGVVLPPSPLELGSAANLKAWYDVGAEAGFGDGDTLTPLTNQVPGAPNKSHFDAVNTPTYQINELDGEPVVEFDAPGSDSYLSREGAGDFFFQFMHQLANGEASFMCIHKPEINGADFDHMIFDNSTHGINAGFSMRYSHSSFDIDWRVSTNASNTINLLNKGVIAMGTWYVIFTAHDDAANYAKIFLDNVEIGSDISVALLNEDPGAFARIGREAGGGSDDEIAGQISQVLFWDADVTADQAAIHTYFKARFPSLNI